MTLLQELIASKIVLGTAVGWTSAQLCKGFLLCFTERSFSLKHFFAQEGGMPSAHSALVSALFFSIYKEEGLSTSCIIAGVFSLIILRDAMGVRQATASHAKMLNALIDRVFDPTHETLHDFT